MVNRIAEQRIKRGVSVEQLSEMSGISINDIIKFEKPDFKIEEMSAVKAARIAKALGCMIEDLIYED
ncbi:MAG: helix-turn-helix transcriptional regulator [Oscillospiraceae bacterium]